MSTLIIAEKSKAAKSIAEALGVIKKIKITQYLYVYQVPSKNIYVIPLRGHLLEYRNTPKYRNWKNPPPREIITNHESIKKYKIKGMDPYIKILQEYAQKCTYCIIGTDADIEGCNIGIIDALPYVKKENPSIKVLQLWLSTLQKNEIENKYQNLIPLKYEWALTGEARAIVDAIIGFAATREITNSFKLALQKFNVNWTSIGRVQTSTLYLLYLREKEIEGFIPENYFTIDAILIAQNEMFRAHHLLNPFKKKDEENAKKIHNKIKNEKNAIINNLNQNLIKRKPPSPLNTNKALILLTKHLRISAKKAMDVLNSLYLNKIISYPRTDTDIYKPDFEHLILLKQFTSHTEYGNYTSNLLKENRIIPTRGKKDAGDHPPITPIVSLELNINRFGTFTEKKAYDLLARHYLALFGNDSTESKQVLELLIKDEPFKAKILSLINDGFFEIVPFLKPKFEMKIEIKDKTIPIKAIEITEKETRPPSKYNDTTLLLLMEKNGLGTKATRPAIIETMEKRKVIYKDKVGKKGSYHCSELGMFLIDSLIKVWLPFLKPDFTKWIEQNLEDIKERKKDINEVIDEIKKRFLELFDSFLSKKVDFLKITKGYQVKTENQFPLTKGKCPKCNSYPMKFINLKKKRFLACSDEACKSYLPLPKKGTIIMLKTTCCLCEMNVFKISTRKNNIHYRYYLCPKCWKEGLDANDNKGFCSNCKDFNIYKGKCVKK